jgi:hypothetical protein
MAKKASSKKKTPSNRMVSAVREIVRLPDEDRRVILEHQAAVQRSQAWIVQRALLLYAEGLRKGTIE